MLVLGGFIKQGVIKCLFCCKHGPTCYTGYSRYSRYSVIIRARHLPLYRHNQEMASLFDCNDCKHCKRVMARAARYSQITTFTLRLCKKKYTCCKHCKSIAIVILPLFTLVYAFHKWYHCPNARQGGKGGLQARRKPQHFYKSIG